MCSLPNMPAKHLDEFAQRRKKQTKKEVETLKITITDCQLIENPI